MKESYGEGLANHTSLESYGDCSNTLVEALTEGSTGGLLSSEITTSRVPTSWSGREGNMRHSVMRVVEQPGGVLELGVIILELILNSGINLILSRAHGKD